GRLLAVGWRRWLRGDYAPAETLLAEAMDRARDPSAAPDDLEPLEPAFLLAQAGYWLARVRLRLGKPEALPGFEALLRVLGGSAPATAWVVGLLWRAGRRRPAAPGWEVGGADQQARHRLRGRAVARSARPAAARRTWAGREGAARGRPVQRAAPRRAVSAAGLGAGRTAQARAGRRGVPPGRARPVPPRRPG